jgi:uncharacterized protein DUF4157
VSWSERERGGDDPDAEGAAAPEPEAPGKRTLTEQALGPTTLMGRPIRGTPTVGSTTLFDVQRKATGAGLVGYDDVAEIAGLGVAGAGGGMPHAGAIQPAFGRHDIGDARAQVGGDAATASSALGASAYTQGDRVGFAAAPDLHTAAHEAAHVVQQRAGHGPAGGLDTPGDHLEQHADRVADAVVAGKSAEPLLDELGAGSPTQGVQRDGDDQPKWVDRVGQAQEFVAKYAEWMAGNMAFTYFDKGPQPQFPSSPLWSVQNAIQLMGRIAGTLFKDWKQMYSTLVRLFGERRVVDMIQRGRDDTVYFGSNHHRFTLPDWHHFETDLRSHLVPLVSDSINRIAPRYCYLRTALAFPEFHRTGKWPYDENVAQVDPSQLVAAHPMDRHVIAALCEPEKYHRTLWVHWEAVAAAFTDIELQASIQGPALRKVKLLLDIDDGLHDWCTVTEPADPTTEEVANELYGDTENATMLVRAGRRFGFPSPFRVSLRKDLQSIWEDKRRALGQGKDDNALEMASDGPVMVQGERDAAREILADPAMAEVAIRGQSQGIKVKEEGKQLGVLQRYSFILGDLAKIEAALKALPGTHTIKPVIDRAKQRADRIKAGDSEAAKTFDVSSNVQLQITSTSQGALDSAVPAWTKMKDNLKAFEGYAELSAPYLQLAGLFADAVAASELPETGLSRLAAAQRFSLELPIEVLEGMDANVRQMIMAARATHDDPDADYQRGPYDYGLSEIESAELGVRDKLRSARELVVADPGKLGALIAEVQETINDLQVNATIVLAVQECDALVHECEVHMPGWFDPTWKGPALVRAQIKVDEWRSKWGKVSIAYSEYKYALPEVKKDKAKALETAFKTLANDEKWKNLHTEIGGIIAHEEKVAKWVRIGILIGIAIATMGAGAWAAGVAEGLELSGLVGGAFVAGTEAITATTLGQMMVDHPTLKGYFLELGTNFVAFAFFRALSSGWRGVAGSGAAATVTEIVGVQLAQTVKAVHDANEAHRAATGKDLSSGEMFDLITEQLIVAGASALIGFAGKRKLDQIRIAGEETGKQWLIQRADHIESIDATTIKIATVAQSSKNAAELYKALANEREALASRQRLFDELLENKGKRAVEAGLDPEALRTQRDEVRARLAENRHAEDMLKLEPVKQGEYLYPHDELPEFMKRQQEEPTKAKVEQLEPDPYTNARRYRISPDGAEPFVVTEKLPGMGRVIGGLSHDVREPASGLPDLGDKPLFAASAVANRTHIRVGHALESADRGLGVLRGLADADEIAFRSIGLDPPAEGFNPSEIEWGLGRRGKEFIIIRGDFESVNWADFPGVEPIAHTHPFRPGKGLRGGTGPDAAIPFEQLLPGGGASQNAMKNRVVIFPSAADVVFAGVRGIDGHHVLTPYRIKTGTDGKLLITHPTPLDVDVPTPDARGKALSFKMGKPEHVGYYEGDLDVPVYKVKLTAEAGGEPIPNGEMEMYAVNHPAHGSLLSHTEPPHMTKVTAGTPPPTGDPITKSGKFVPSNEVERRAAATWKTLQDTTYTGPKIASFEDDFLPMYRQGWEFDVEAQHWKKPGTGARARQFPDNVTPETAYERIHHDDRFIQMLLEEKLATPAEIMAELKAHSPAGKFEDVVRANVKAAFHSRVVDKVGSLTAEELKIPPSGDDKARKVALAAARHNRLLEMTRHLDPSERNEIAAEYYREHFTHEHAEGPTTIERADNPNLHLAGDRALDAIDVVTEGGGVDTVDIRTAVKLRHGDGVMTPREIQEARDLRRLVGKQVNGETIERVRYVFMSAEGAKRNLAFIGAILEGEVEVRLFDPQGRPEHITKRADMEKPELKWLTSDRDGKETASEFKRTQQRIAHELRGNEFQDAADSAGSHAADYSADHRTVVDAKAGYDLKKMDERQRLVADLVARVTERAKRWPKGTRQGLFVDLRGQEVDEQTLERIRARIIDESNGVVRFEDIVFMEGEAPKGGASAHPAIDPARKTLTAAECTPKMEIDPAQVNVFRGGPWLNVRENTDVQYVKGTNKLKLDFGLSLDVNASAMDAFGGAYRIDSIPPELRIVQRGTKNLGHFEIMPRVEMTFDRYKELVSQIKLIGG